MMVTSEWMWALNMKQSAVPGSCVIVEPIHIDCIDYITGIGNAHAHNGVHSVLRLGSQLLVVPLMFL